MQCTHLLLVLLVLQHSEAVERTVWKYDPHSERWEPTTTEVSSTHKIISKSPIEQDLKPPAHAPVAPRAPNSPGFSKTPSTVSLSADLSDPNDEVSDRSKVLDNLAASLCGGTGTVEVPHSGPLAPIAPSLLNEHSLFVIGMDRALYERCWKGVKWVWLRHEAAPGQRSVTQLANRDRAAMYVLGADGYVIQRRVSFDLRTMKSTWTWNSRMGDCQGLLRISSLGGRSPSDGSLFALTTSGRLVQWCASPFSNGGGAVAKAQDGQLAVFENGEDPDQAMSKHVSPMDDHWTWVDHGSPEDSDHPENGSIRAISTFVLNDQSLFVVRNDGRLFESLLDPAADVPLRRRWIDHGKTPSSLLSGPPGALINLRSFFLVSKSKRLWERYFDVDSGAWTWVDHSSPAGRVNLDVDVAPLAIHERCVFVTGEDKRLYERAYTKACARNKCSWKWQWKDHGKPATTSFATQPGASPSVKSVFLVGTDQHLYERHFRGNGWVHLQHMGEGGSHLSCFAGYGTIPVNTTLRCFM